MAKESANPDVIFTTAIEHYAIKAIRFSSLDYLKSEGGHILMNDNQQVSISPKKRDEFFARMN